MTPGRRVVRETTRSRVTGPGSGVAGAADVDTTKTATALASSRIIRREAIPVVSSRHDHYTTPRTGDSAALELSTRPGVRPAACSGAERRAAAGRSCAAWTAALRAARRPPAGRASRGP